MKSRIKRLLVLQLNADEASTLDFILREWRRTKEATDGAIDERMFTSRLQHSLLDATSAFRRNV